MTLIVPVLDEGYSLAGIEALGAGLAIPKRTSELGEFGPSVGHAGNFGYGQPFGLGVGGATTPEVASDSF
jgi:hypothetical protein